MNFAFFHTKGATGLRLTSPQRSNPGPRWGSSKNEKSAYPATCTVDALQREAIQFIEICNFIPSASVIRFSVAIDGFAAPLSIFEISDWSIPVSAASSI